MRSFGVHSEVGKLRTVMVCRPGLAHQRLTPGNCHDLLFDDVIWVHEAQKDHYDFVLKMQERGVEVFDLHDLLAQTLEIKEAREFILDRRVTANSVGTLTVAAIRPWLDEMAPQEHWRHILIGGIAICRSAGERGFNTACRRIRRHRVHPAADSEHAVSARSVLLDLRRRDLQSDVLAGPQARDAPAARRLQVPPLVQRRRLQDLVGRFGRGLCERVDGRRRCHADRQGHRAHRHGRAHNPSSRLSGSASAVQAQGRDARHCLPHAEEPGGHASGHGLQLLRPRRRHDLPGGGRSDQLLQRLSG